MAKSTPKRPTRVVPHRAAVLLPDNWWLGTYPGGFSLTDPEDLAYLLGWGVTHVAPAGGRGKPRQIQTEDEARGNHAWMRLCVRLREAGRSAEIGTLPTYPRARTHPAVMGCGGKGKPGKVIDFGMVREYVGIGWVVLRPARPKDYLKIPRLVE